MTKVRSSPLEAGSAAVGDAWVEQMQLDLRLANRRVHGGWPGTLSEARARTHAAFAGALSGDELEVMARAVNERARRRWLDQVRG